MDDHMDNSLSKSPTTSSVLLLRLTSLTPELKHAIFVCLPDVSSAKALALTSSSFYQNFLGTQALILTKVLHNEIDTEMLRAGFAALQVSQINVWSKEAILKILNAYFEGSLILTSHAWTLAEALAMSKVHDCAEFFASEFASFALSQNPTARGANAAPSSNEMRRIKLTLHRFDLYCNLFRHPRHDRMVRDKLNRNRLIRPDPFSAQEQQKVFLSKFSFWEIEQLGCIHDFLIQAMTAPFRDVAKHDVQWGCDSVPYIDDRIGEKVYKESYLARGLEYLHRLVTANTYDARYKILNESNPEPCQSGRYGKRLSDVLQSRVEDDGVPLKAYTEEEERFHLRPSFDSDNDPGPVEAWRWAHSESSRGQFYFREDHRSLRQRGYVMWDLERLHNWSLIEKPVQEMIARRVPGYPERLRLEAEWDEQAESFIERSRIWEEGGRGWWAPGDESHIRWPRQHEKSRVPFKQRHQMYALALPKPLKV